MIIGGLVVICLVISKETRECLSILNVNSEQINTLDLISRVFLIHKR